MKERLLIIDGNALLHRAYHALPRLTTKSGKLVNAAYGFLLTLFRTVKEFQPTHITVCFDSAVPTFRHKEFEEYKATRPKAPEDLYAQLPAVKHILSAFNIPVVEKEGFEADDLIGTVSRSAEKHQIETIILSNDLDILQLINESNRVYSLKRGLKDAVLYDEKVFSERYQISPSQIADFKALRGDPSDNLPGVPGIGEKTAIVLLKKFSSVEEIYEMIEKSEKEISPLTPLVIKNLKESKKQAFFVKGLAKLNLTVPILFNLSDCKLEGYNEEEAIQVLKELEFYSLVKSLPVFNNKTKTTGRLF